MSGVQTCVHAVKPTDTQTIRIESFDARRALPCAFQLHSLPPCFPRRLRGPAFSAPSASSVLVLRILHTYTSALHLRCHVLSKLAAAPQLRDGGQTRRKKKKKVQQFLKVMLRRQAPEQEGLAMPVVIEEDATQRFTYPPLVVCRLV